MARSPGGDDVSFISNDHPVSLLGNIKKCFNQERFTDIQLQVDGKIFRAHKIILSSSSPYFEVMFAGGLSESKMDSVHIHGIDGDIFQLLLDFIYTGAIIINSDNVQNLLSAADMLQLPEVVAVCCKYLKSQLHPCNCIGILTLANALSCEGLLSDAKHFTEENFVEVVKGEEFLDLDQELLLCFLESEELRIETELQVFEAALLWILHDPKERRQLLVQILEHIRFSLIQPERLFSNIESCSDMSTQIALKTLLAEYNPQKKAHGPRNPFTKYQTNSKPRRRSRKYLMVIGGYKRRQGGRWYDVQTISAVHVFDTYHEEWTVSKGLHYSRSSLTAVCIKDTLFAIGGEQESLLFDNVEKMSILDKKWEDGPELPSPLSGHGACEIDGLIYVFGGCKGSEVSDSILCLDPAEGIWRRVGKMTTRRTNFGLAVIEGMVYIAGGTDVPDGEAAFRSVECYNPVTKEWSNLPNMRHSRSLCGLAAIDNTLFAVGGCNVGKKAMTSVEMLHLDEKSKWRSVNPMSTARAGAAVVAVNRMLYAIGGRTAGNDTSPPVTLSTGECFDTQSGLWRHLKPIPIGRCEAAIAVV